MKLEVTFSYTNIVILYTQLLDFNDLYLTGWGCHRDLRAKAMDGANVVSEFVLQSRYYVHFRANTLGKGMKPFILPAMG